MIRFKQFLIEDDVAKIAKFQFLDLSPENKEKYERDRKRRQEILLSKGLPKDPSLDIPWDNMVSMAKKEIEDELRRGPGVPSSDKSLDGWVRAGDPGLDDNTTIKQATRSYSNVDPIDSAIQRAKDVLNLGAAWLSKEANLAKDTAIQAYERMHYNSKDVRRPGNIQSKDEREAGVKYRPAPSNDPKIDKYYQRYTDLYPERFGPPPLGTMDSPPQPTPSVDMLGFSLFSPEEMEKGIPISSGYRQSIQGLEDKKPSTEMWWHPYGRFARQRNKQSPEGWAAEIGITPEYKHSSSPRTPNTTGTGQMSYLVDPSMQRFFANTNLDPIEAYVNTEDLGKFEEWKKYYKDLPYSIETRFPWLSPNFNRYEP